MIVSVKRPFVLAKGRFIQYHKIFLDKAKNLF